MGRGGGGAIGSGMGGAGEDVRKVSENWTELYSTGGWGTEGSHQKVPEDKKARDFQHSTGMTLTEMLNKEEQEPL